VQPETEGEPAGLILIAVKQHYPVQSIENIRNFVGPKTISKKRKGELFRMANRLNNAGRFQYKRINFY
jgi:hypothetical protein